MGKKKEQTRNKNSLYSEIWRIVLGMMVWSLLFLLSDFLDSTVAKWAADLTPTLIIQPIMPLNSKSVISTASFWPSSQCCQAVSFVSRLRDHRWFKWLNEEDNDWKSLVWWHVFESCVRRILAVTLWWSAEHTICVCSLMWPSVSPQSGRLIRVYMHTLPLGISEAL